MQYASMAAILGMRSIKHVNVHNLIDGGNGKVDVQSTKIKRFQVRHPFLSVCMLYMGAECSNGGDND